MHQRHTLYVPMLLIAWNLTSRPSTLRPLRYQVYENAATARNSLDTQALDGEKEILPAASPASNTS